jgi:hypothetical protein
VAGADDAYGNLAAVRDENLLEHFLEQQRGPANPRFYRRFHGRGGPREENKPKPQRTYPFQRSTVAAFVLRYAGFSAMVQFEKSDSYQGIALAMPPTGVRR